MYAYYVVYRGKWNKLEHIFITHKSYKTLGGSIEMAGSVTDIGNRITKLHFHGSGYLVSLLL